MIGYEYLLSRIPLRRPPLAQPAKVRRAILGSQVTSDTPIAERPTRRKNP